MIMHCKRGLGARFPLKEMIPSRFALGMHQDSRWSTKIRADLIFLNTPSPGRSDYFKIRADALKFMRARFNLWV